MTELNRRLAWVDLARSFAIFFVVYRHVVIGISRGGFTIDSFWFDVQEWTFNFRMPLFFILSGIFLEMSLKSGLFRKVLSKRVGNILYPYFLWGSITICVQAIFSRFSNSERSVSDVVYLLIQPRKIDHFWYLLALFNSNLLFILIRKCGVSLRVNMVFGLILYIVANLPIMKGLSLFSDVFYFYIYVSAGAFVSARILNGHDSASRPSVGSAMKWLILLFFVQFLWYKNRDDISVFILLIVNIVSSFLFFRILEIVSSFRLPEVLYKFGKYSLYIYVMHVIISGLSRNAVSFLFPQSSGLFAFSFVFPLSLLLPVYLYKISQKLGFTYLFQLSK